METTPKNIFIPTPDKAPATWDHPLSLQNPELDAFPLEDLPEGIRHYVEALSENVQTPVDMAATVSLTILSSLMQGQFHVEVKNGWKEPLNLYSLVILPPSERKSAIMNTLLKPINQLEEEVNADLKEKIKNSESQMRILASQQAILEKRAAKGEDVDGELAEINAEIANFKEVKPYRFYLDNVTPEAITSSMAANNNKAAIFSSEGGLFDIMGGSYSSSTNIDVLLKAYSGDSIRCDRITRSSETISNPRLTMQLMAQPSVLEGVMSNDVFRGRGLTARFLYCLPKPAIGSRKFLTDQIPPETETVYVQLIRDLFMADQPREESIPLWVEPEALLVLNDYANYLEPRLIKEFSDIESWCGKVVGTSVRIAGILTVAKEALSHPGAYDPTSHMLNIDYNTMVSAIWIAMYYTSHAQAAFTLMCGDQLRQQCLQVLKIIREKKMEQFSRRDIMRSSRQFKSADDIQRVLNHLEDCAYIMAEEEAPLPGRGRKPNVHYKTNPLAFSKPESDL